MDPAEIKHFIEAALLAAGRPLNVEQIQKLFDGRMTPERSEIRQAVTTLNEEYEGRGILISEVASGFRVQVRSGMADQLQKLWEERPPRYSRAMFETLALVAYRQPITRGEIEEIRGVSVSSNIVRTLLEREWVRIVGHRDVPGRPEMFGTTKFFLDYFGLKKLDDLPPLADLSDWESLRVQLNLPEVEEGAGEGDSEGTDLPVLYPEIPAEEADDSSDESEAVPEESSEVPEDNIPELIPVDSDSDEVADDLLVSKWPDPAEIGS